VNGVFRAALRDHPRACENTVVSMEGLEMYVKSACEALQSGMCLEIKYDGYTRLVEVHAVGYTEEGNPIMRVWQVSGGSVSGERIGWKLLRLDETLGAAVSSQQSKAPRSGYKPGDKAMKRILCQL
jgi:hypothetical protein